MTPRRAPRPVAVALDALTRRLAPATLLADVQRVWGEAAGAAIAEAATPLSERDGTLTLLCSSAVWMHEIDLMGPVLVDALNGALGSDRVRAVRCVATAGRRRTS
ncbi:MAG TPA: DciA family protein [Solirubrobacteraceae bacterium]|nr:DciA family protein [Solirubrobacteraceae bacterium]